ncbi:hypothetical protein [Streptomyces sp. NPDC058757]|uniref:hypothetical protein n=1 Tax=Streptomyces sp. NPDC058757 TaxID=3346626 RepID=UPI0036769ABE
MTRPDRSFLHHPHPWLGCEVEDTTTGRRGILRAIAPEDDAPYPKAWLLPAGGGTEWTTDVSALAEPAHRQRERSRRTPPGPKTPSPAPATRKKR